MARAQTIQIYLPSGDPQGMRIASVPTRTVQVFEVPRKLLPDFLARPEAKQVGVYFLIGQDDRDNPLAYIGQTGNLGERLAAHSEKKPFWTRAFAAVSLTNEWTQTHALFLEWASIRQATDVQRMALQNGNLGQTPYTPDPMQADCEEYLATTRMLLSTLGVPLLEPAKRGTPAPTADEPIDDGVEVQLTGRGCVAQGVYSSQGLLVLKGSKGRLKGGQGQPAYIDRLRLRVEELAEEGTLEILPDGTTRFLRDHLFASPSGAACAVYCMPANGRAEWQTPDGTSIATLEDRALEQVADEARG